MMLITKKRGSRRGANLEGSLSALYNREYYLAKMVIKVNNSCSSKEDKLKLPFSLNITVSIEHMKIYCCLVHCRCLFTRVSGFDTLTIWAK